MKEDFRFLTVRTLEQRTTTIMSKYLIARCTTLKSENLHVKSTSMLYSIEKRQPVILITCTMFDDFDPKFIKIFESSVEFKAKNEKTIIMDINELRIEFDKLDLTEAGAMHLMCLIL